MNKLIKLFQEQIKLELPDFEVKTLNEGNDFAIILSKANGDKFNYNIVFNLTTTNTGCRVNRISNFIALPEVEKLYLPSLNNLSLRNSNWEDILSSFQDEEGESVLVLNEEISDQNLNHLINIVSNFVRDVSDKLFSRYKSYKDVLDYSYEQTDVEGLANIFGVHFEFKLSVLNYLEGNQEYLLEG